MKCKQCGKKVPKGAQVCPYCRSNELEEGTSLGKKLIKNKKIIIVIALIVVALLVGALVSWNLYFKYKKINIEKYVELSKETETDEGDYNGCGFYSYYLDEDKLVDDIFYSSSNDNHSKKEIRELVEDRIKIKDDEENGKLSNGDNYSVKIKYHNSDFHLFGVHLFGGSKTKKVRGLEKTVELDPFNGAKIITKGASPRLKVAVINPEHEGLSDYYLIDGQETDIDGDVDSYHVPFDYPYSSCDYKKGDNVKVSIKEKIYYEDDVVYLLTNRKHTFRIEKAPVFLTNTDNINKHSMSGIIKRGKKLIGNCIDVAGYIENYSLAYKGAFLCVSKDGNSSNQLYTVFKINHDDPGYGIDGKGYVAVSAIDPYFDGEYIGEREVMDPFTQGETPDESGDDFLYEFIYSSVEDLYSNLEDWCEGEYKIYAAGDL